MTDSLDEMLGITTSLLHHAFLPIFSIFHVLSRAVPYSCDRRYRKPLAGQLRLAEI